MSLQISACQRSQFTTIVIPDGYSGAGFIVPVCDKQVVSDTSAIYQLDSNGIVYVDTAAIVNKKLRFVMKGEDISSRVKVFQDEFSLAPSEYNFEIPWEGFQHFTIIVNTTSDYLDNVATRDVGEYYMERDWGIDRRRKDLIARRLLDISRYCWKVVKLNAK